MEHVTGLSERARPGGPQEATLFVACLCVLGVPLDLHDRYVLLAPIWGWCEALAMAEEYADRHPCVPSRSAVAALRGLVTDLAVAWTAPDEWRTSRRHMLEHARAIASAAARRMAVSTT